jgi:predicted nucleic acid-binding protein
MLTVHPAHLEEAWRYFQRRDLHQLSAVDATSFVLMSHAKIRTAFAFDHHFTSAGSHLVG